MTTTTTTPPDPAALLHLLTWLSPAFPTGGFAYSHGLEWAVQAGDVTDEATLHDWLADLLTLGSLRADAILLRHAHAAWADPAALAGIAELAAAATPCLERQSETLAQGAAFAAAATPWRAAGAPMLEPVAYPVAVGALAGAHGIAVEAACLALLHAQLANLISAAVRLVPLGQSAGLRVLRALEPALHDTVTATRDAALDDVGGACFRADLAAMRHETQYTRLFRS